MKVYSAPNSIPAPDYDFRNYDPKQTQAAEDKHFNALKAWAIASGFAGPRTGERLYVPHADGYAQYMYADRGAKSALFHLPYGDAWHAADVEYLPRLEVLRRMKARTAMTEMFANP